MLLGSCRKAHCQALTPRGERFLKKYATLLPLEDAGKGGLPGCYRDLQANVSFPAGRGVQECVALLISLDSMSTCHHNIFWDDFPFLAGRDA